MDILTALTGIFRELFDDDSITLTPETSSDDIDGWDSFAHLNLMLMVEDCFKIQISEAEGPTLRNVQNLISFIGTKQRES